MRTIAMHGPRHVALAIASVAALLAGCEKTTTVTQTPSGTVTTTTLAPSADASAAMARVDASLARAASAVQSSDAASAALDKLGSAIEDGAVTAQIKAALLADADLRALRVDVDTHAGVVTLKGTVPTAASLARVERIAHDARGVKSVDSQLLVQAPA
jgi:hyperosmotically inducible protein